MTRQVSQPPFPDAAPENTPRWREAIAIVGMGARFPRSPSVDAYWRHLTQGADLLTQAKDEELRSAGIDPASTQGKYFVRSGTLLENAESFDAGFFGMTRREAEITDPQQRIFLECAYEAMENAGLAGEGTRVGVFAGSGMNTYLLQLLGDPDLMAAAGGYQLMLGNDKDFLATRVAYKLHLRGPAVTIQTACSTSLAAVHLACQSLLAGECDSALAGGVSVMFPQVAGYVYTPGMILSPDGVCRPFDERAHGTVPGKGAGVVVLKRLSDARAAADTIYAVIAGSAWNNDGADKVGYTAPSVQGQATAIRAAQAAAGIHPDRIAYVEAHGTGTELGDPIEVAALTEVFGNRPGEAGRCILSSVKANMGHADVAAGVASLIKAACAVHYGTIPGTPHFERAKPALGIEESPFRITAQNEGWPQGATERWAGVSSFGIGGTNVHLCLHSAPAMELDAKAGGGVEGESWAFPLSAKTPAALEASVIRLADFAEATSGLDPASAAFTLQSGRRSYAHRRAAVAGSREELSQVLRKPRKADKGAAGPKSDKVAFLFPGQGLQFPGMAASLYAVDGAFRERIDSGLALLQEGTAKAIRDAICGLAQANGEEPSAMPTSVAQPLLFLVEYALAMRWIDLGVQPNLLLGHSLGELTAATVAGVFRFEDGLQLAATRGRLMQEMVAGAMLAVSLPVEEASRYVTENLWIAAENGPKLTVVSGTPVAIEELERRLSAARVATVRLRIDRAFHSPQMAEAATHFQAAVAAVERGKPAIPWLSNATGTWITPEEATAPEYWAGQMTSRVRFVENAAELAGRGYFLLEVGPGEALAGLVRSHDRSLPNASSLGGANRSGDDLRSFLEAAARIWETGWNLRWEQLPGRAARRRKVALPTYPFERERYWVEQTLALGVAASKVESSQEAPLEKRQDLSTWFYLPTWQRTPAAPVRTRGPETIATWLILEDEREGEPSFARLLGVWLEQDGCRVLVLPPSAASSQQLERFWAENREVIAGVKLGLICCWTLRGVEIDLYGKLLQLLQSSQLARVRFARAEFLLDDYVEINGERVEDTRRAVVEGLARVLPAEFAKVRVGFIDPGSLSSASEDPVVVGRVAGEIVGPAEPGRMMAWRGQTRWQQVWQPVVLEPAAVSKLRAGGTYVITGGLGGVGYLLARHLLGRYGAKVALVGRTVLPARERWESWLTEYGPGHPVSRRIQRATELEQLGGELLLLSADVADAQAMAEAWLVIERAFGPAHGVIHAAGLSDGARIAAQSVESAENVFRPKVQGSEVLANLLTGRELDFLLFCSSISALLPIAGASAYAAANMFQDRYAVWCRQHLGLPVISINFDAWQEVGMAAEMPAEAEFEAIKEARMRLAMSPKEGIEVLERLLAWGEPQVMVSTVEFSSVLRSAMEGIQLSPLAGNRGEGLPGSADENDSADANEVGGTPETRAVIAIWKELLGAEGIDAGDNFFELGGHSLLGTQILARIREQFEVELSIRAIFEAPTPESLGARIREARPVGSRTEVTVPGDREEFEF